MAQALAYAHSLGVVHRDIKPENILLSREHALVTDFGIARAITEAGGDRLTETGLAVGTAAYMIPEQAAAERRLDGRTDIYSLGCVLYEMLAGQTPFVGPSVQAVIARKLTDPVPPLRTVRESVPATLHQIVHKALARAPAERFATAASFAVALAHVKAETTESLAQPAARSGHRSWSRTFRKLRVLISVGAVTALIGLGGYFWSRESKEDWSREVALPQATKLNGQGRLYQAFRLLRRAETHLGDDPMVRDLLVEWSGPVNVTTTPSGARVYVRDFFDPPDSADLLGSSPLKVRLPLGHLVWKISAPDFETRELLAWTRYRDLEFRLWPVAEARLGMVRVENGGFSLPWTEPVELENYWIDKYEVTNSDFMKFVTAGGYHKQQYWKQPFVKDKRAISWNHARRMLHDRTGRPGPGTWELGTYPEGRSGLPGGRSELV